MTLKQAKTICVEETCEEEATVACEACAMRLCGDHARLIGGSCRCKEHGICVCGTPAATIDDYGEPVCAVDDQCHRVCAEPGDPPGFEGGFAWNH
jgi:hypothetical protein